jgi:hypothetical protein
MVSSLAALALAVSASAGFACDHEAQAADAKNAKDSKDVKAVAANGEAKGCDMPCCAHAAAAAANDKIAANAAGDKPCSAHDTKGCPKKGATTVAVAKVEPAKDSPKAEPAKDGTPPPAADPGTHR